MKNQFNKKNSKSPAKSQQELFSLLVCPLSGGELIYDEVNCELVCCISQLAYPIRDGIPVMLVSEARNCKNNQNKHAPIITTS